MLQQQYSNETWSALQEDKRFKLLSSTNQGSTTLFTASETASDVDFMDNNRGGALSAGGARLPEVGNVDTGKLREFRDSYMKNNVKGSLARRGDFTFNELNIKNLSENLVGREDEIQILQNVFDKTTQGQGPGIVTIKAPPGTGKSVLANQLQKQSQKVSGFFCVGHFLDCNEPYTGFSEALSGLVQQILSKDHSFTSTLIEQIEESVADDLPLLLNFIPRLKKLGFDSSIFENQPMQEAKVSNRANQLRVVLRKFIRALLATQDELPLVLILNDVHLADPSSILLMTSLATDTKNSYFCMVTTSRPENEAQLSPFYDSLVAQSDNISHQSIELEDLHFSAAHSIVCTALRSNEENPKVNEMSKLVYEKTHGNPFFMLAFLQNLVDEDLLDYNLGTLSFSWNIDAIKQKSATQNVGDLTSAILEKLDPELQSILQVSSCLSHAFNIDELTFVVRGVQRSDEFQDMPFPSDIDEALEILSGKGILTSGWLPSTYTFAHNQTMTAASNLTQFKKRNHLRLVIGQRLIKGMGNQAKMDRYLCLAADLCNTGLSLLKQSEIIQLAKWNLLAGEFTLQKGAFASALKYFEIGIECLGKDFWHEHSKVALALHCGAAEAASCSGEFEKNEKYSESVFESNEDFTVQQCLRIHSTRIAVLGAQEHFVEAVEIGRHVMKELGVVDIPKAPSMLMVIREIMKSKKAAKGLTQEKILALPSCKDEKRIAAMGIINHLATMAYMANPNFFLVMYLKSFRWTIKYGITQYSPVAIGTFGVILCSVLNDPKEGYKFGEAALELAKARNLPVQRATTISAVYGYVYHWTQPLRHALLPLAFGHKVGLENGETEIAFTNIGNHDAVTFITAAKPLDELLVDLDEHCKMMDEYKQDAMKAFSVVLTQYTFNMIGDDNNLNPKKLTGSRMNEQKLLLVAKEKNNRFLEAFIDHFRMELSYFFGDYEGAVKIAEMTMDYGVKVAQSTMHIPRFSFLVGLSHLAVASKLTTNKQRKKHINVGIAMKKRFEGWLKNGNVNSLHMLKLLDAEIYALQQKASIEKSEALYKDAVTAASQSSFVHDRALAHERAALFFLNAFKDDTFWASYHMKNAVECYRDWGAKVKVMQLQAVHSKLLDNDAGV